MKLYAAYDFPVEYSVPCDYLLRAKAVCLGEHVAQVCNLSRDKISLVKHTSAEIFDKGKIKRDNLYVDRSPFGGAAMYCGSGDVTYSFHINRDALINALQPAGEIYRGYTNLVCASIANLGIEVRVRDEPVHNRKTGVCLNLEGRSEIVDKDGRKLAGSIYKDDGLIVSIHGIILVTEAWKKIYDYIKNIPPRASATSLGLRIPGVATSDVMGSLVQQLEDVESVSYTGLDYRAMHLLAPTFEYGRWQE